MTEATQDVVISFPSELSDELAPELTAAGIDYQPDEDPNRALIAVPVVVAVAVGVGALLSFIRKIWEVTRLQQVFIFKDGKLDIRLGPVRNGKILIFADEKTVVTVKEVPDFIDLGDIAKHAITTGADAAKAALEAAGGKGDVEEPEDEETKELLKELAS